MPLSHAQAHELIAAAHDHAAANGWKITVAVVDEGGLLVALGRMDGAFPLSAQIAEAKAAGTSLWHRDGDGLAATHASHPGFFDAVSSLAPAPADPRPGRAGDPGRRGRARRGRCERRERRRRPGLRRGGSAGDLRGVSGAARFASRGAWARRGGAADAAPPRASTYALAVAAGLTPSAVASRISP